MSRPHGICMVEYGQPPMGAFLSLVIWYALRVSCVVMPLQSKFCVKFPFA
jgi:hypothetical protein